MVKRTKSNKREVYTLRPVTPTSTVAKRHTSMMQ